LAVPTSAPARRLSSQGEGLKGEESEGEWSRGKGIENEYIRYMYRIVYRETSRNVNRDVHREAVYRDVYRDSTEAAYQVHLRSRPEGHQCYIPNYSTEKVTDTMGTLYRACGSAPQ
jgi:hypothetical protein